MSPIDDEVTPPDTYFKRRTFLKRAGIVGGSVVATGFAYRRLNGAWLEKNNAAVIEDIVPASSGSAQGFSTEEPPTPEAKITHYNNFYEFSTDKDSVAEAASGFRTDGWKVSIEGMVERPRVFDLDDIRKLSAPEESASIRMRCVEGWSMVIPWVGFSLSKLLAAVAPLGSAKYVAFQSPRRTSTAGCSAEASRAFDAARAMRAGSSRSRAKVEGSAHRAWGGGCARRPRISSSTSYPSTRRFGNGC